MNILPLAKTLKNVKLSDLDYQLETIVLTKFNSAVPEDCAINGETTGIELRNIVDTKLNPETRAVVLQIDFFTSVEIVSFMTVVESVQNDNKQTQEYSDGIKSTVVSVSTIALCFVVAFFLMTYHLTKSSRGRTPESKVMYVIENVSKSLSNLQPDELEQPAE